MDSPENFTTEQPKTPLTNAPVVEKDKKHLLLILAGVVLLAAIVITAFYVHSRNNKHPSTNNTANIQPVAQVSVAADGFTPATIRIKKGQTVTWTDSDGKAYQVAADPYPAENSLKGFVADTPMAAQGETFSFTFEETGTFTYHDHLNPYGLKGTVIVE